MTAFLRFVRALVASSLLLAGLDGWPRGAFAQTPAEPVPEDTSAPPLHESLALCVREHETGRVQKTELRLFEARKALARCASNDCPVAIRVDCQNWANEVEAQIPTVLVVVEGDPKARASLRVSVDGRPLTADLDRPIELAPGEHRFRFELEPFPPSEQRIELTAGDKNRIVRVRFAARSDPAPTPVSPSPPPAVPNRVESRPIPRLTYVLGASAALSATASAVLLGSALIDQGRANDRCAPFCSQEVVDSIDRRLLLADLAGVSAVLLGTLTAYSYLTRPTESQYVGQRRASLQIRPLGAGVLVGGEF